MWWETTEGFLILFASLPLQPLKEWHDQNFCFLKDHFGCFQENRLYGANAEARRPIRGPLHRSRRELKTVWTRAVKLEVGSHGRTQDTLWKLSWQAADRLGMRRERMKSQGRYIWKMRGLHTLVTAVVGNQEFSWGHDVFVVSIRHTS